jgi:hypothetical protein
VTDSSRIWLPESQSPPHFPRRPCQAPAPSGSPPPPPPAAPMSKSGGKGFYATRDGSYVPTSTVPSPPFPFYPIRFRRTVWSPSQPSVDRRDLVGEAGACRPRRRLSPGIRCGWMGIRVYRMLRVWLPWWCPGQWASKGYAFRFWEKL